MSYLSSPRLQFTAYFTANPSTLNNTLENYNVDETGQLQPAWNPYGSHAWTITGGVVTSFVDQAGVLHTNGDPVIGSTIQNVAEGHPAVLVDLDTDQQGRTQLFGLELELSLPGSPGKSLLRGAFLNTGCLSNLWFGRVPGGTNPDSDAGGCFQSVLEHCVWGDLATSPLLQQLRQASPDGLSIRLTTYAYDAASSSPTFTRGKLVGVIGPWQAGEPRHIAGTRLLGVPLAANGAPANVLWNAPARVDASRKVLLLDLGNAIPESAVGGPPLSLGQLRAALLPATGTPVLLGNTAIDYSAGQYLLTAGIAEVPLTERQVEMAQTLPLALLTTAGPGAPVQVWQIALQEAANGLYATTDQASVRMDPGDTASVALYAWTFGQPAAALTLPLRLLPASGQPWDNSPAGALRFPSAVTTDATGQASISLLAGDPVPKPSQRQSIDGQVYFIGDHSWLTTLDFYETAPLTVKVSNSRPPQPHPTWGDVQPILQQYYVLYGYMASIVDLSNYTSVKNSAPALKNVLTKPFSDPGYMPVSRDLSRDDRNLILAWIELGCPA